MVHRIDTSTAVPLLPATGAAGTPGYWTGGNPQGGLPATTGNADFFNMLTEELMACLTAAGIAPVKGTYNQLLASIQKLFVAKAGGTMTGALGIGMVPVNVLDITQSQAAVSHISIANPNTSTISGAAVSASNGTNSVTMGINSTGYAAFGMNRVDGAALASSGAGGLSVFTNNLKPLYFGVNFSETGRFDLSGNLLVGKSDADRGTNGLVQISSATASVTVYAPTGTAAKSWGGHITAGPSGDNFCGLVLQAPTTTGGIAAGSETYADVLRATYTTIVASTNGVERWRTATGGNFLIGTSVDDGVHRLQVSGTATATAPPLTDNSASLITSGWLLSQFTGSNQSMGSPGYQKLPGGLILQWTQATINTGFNTLTWPIAFPNGVFTLIANMAGGFMAWAAAGQTATTAVIGTNNSGTAQATQIWGLGH